MWENWQFWIKEIVTKTSKYDDIDDKDDCDDDDYEDEDDDKDEVMTMIRHLISKVALDKPKWLLLIEISGMSPLQKEQL